MALFFYMKRAVLVAKGQTNLSLLLYRFPPSHNNNNYSTKCNHFFSSFSAECHLKSIIPLFLLDAFLVCLHHFDRDSTASSPHTLHDRHDVASAYAFPSYRFVIFVVREKVIVYVPKYSVTI